MEQETASDGEVQVQTTLRMQVTDLARDKLGQFLDGRSLSEVGVQVQVMPGGCSGAQYGLQFANGPAEGEIELTSNGVRIFVEPQYATVLNGCIVDFVDELMGGGFKIENPNATATCGCGKSFSA